jgi:PAS domain S-box-containing protein
MKTPILVVDDREEDLLAITAVLVGEDYELVTARSGHEALLKVLATNFAVILLDVHLPDIDGFEVATIIKQRERSRHTPILFLTADENDSLGIYKAYSVGAVDYLAKPMDPDVVRAKVGIFADLYRKDQRIRSQADALRLVAERRYQNLSEAVPEIVLSAEADGTTTHVNRRWTEYTGSAPEVAHGKLWLDGAHHDDATEIEPRWRAALTGRQELSGELRLQRHDGVWRWHRYHVVPELDGGTLVGWIGTFSDCDDLKQAVRARDEFLSIASHELRTPLTALQLQLQAIEGRIQSSATTRVLERLDTALRQTRRLERLIENLLDVSRIATGQMRLDREHVDLGSTVAEVLERLGEHAHRAGCPLSVRCASGVTGEWDHLRLEQVITNLVVNAIQYAPGAPIEISVDNLGESARLQVRDHGAGISSADAERIFGRFERAVSARAIGGLGMGLYISRQIVEAHHGKITVESQPGDGATFIIDLPRA